MSRQILPCWAAHSRMGHDTRYGYAEPYAGTSILLTVPAIEGDDQHSPLDEEVHVLPMEGPAFYGFEVLTEEQVRARLASKRPWKPATFLPAPVEEDAVEVPAEVPALDCKPVGTPLTEFSVADLHALPDGSRFSDGGDSWDRAGDKWLSDAEWPACTHADLIVWGVGLPYALTRIGPAPIVQAAPISSEVRPAAAVGQRVFLSRLDRLTETAERARTSGWYLVTEVATTAGVLGAPIVVEKAEDYRGDLAHPIVRYVLTLTEWAQNVATVIDADGHIVFDEVPF